MYSIHGKWLLSSQEKPVAIMPEHSKDGEWLHGELVSLLRQGYGVALSSSAPLKAPGDEAEDG